MTDLVAFLTARYDEEAQRWKTIWRFKAGDKRIDGWWDLGGTFGRTVNAVIDTTHGGRDIAAKRRILARHAGCADGEGCCSGRTVGRDHCDDVADLAAPYADHPDFNPAWGVA